jgi:outer membrane receptor protein involved in Fe transport
MMQHRQTAIAACASILLWAGAAKADPDDIIVTGQGLGGTRGDAAYDLVVIDRDRLTMSASGRMEDVLRDAAGFQQFRRSDARSAHPTSQGATLRGLGGNASTRALILLDGVPMVDPFGGWVSWAALDPARIGQVRVTRGGGSGVFGPGALAGTIEMSSVAPADADRLTAGVSYGSRNAVDADVGASAKLGTGFFSLSGGYARGDGFIPIIAADRGPIDRAARYKQSRLSGRVVVPIGSETELQANGSFLLDERDRGLPFTNNRNLGIDTSLRLVGHGHWRWEATSWLQVRQFSSGFASVNATRTVATQSLDQYNVPATGFGGRFEIRPPLGDSVTVRLGGDARHVDGRTEELFTFVAGSPTRRRVAGGNQTLVGGFADGSFQPLENLTLTAGGRIDHWSIEDGSLIERVLATAAFATNSAFPDRSGNEATARAGIAWKPVGTFTVRSAVYTGWRLPTLNELYRPFRVGADVTQANAALDPERMKGVDIGADYHPLPGWHLGGTLFWNRLDHAIANITIAPSIARRGNLDAIRSRGVEIDGGAAFGDWRLGLGYSHVDARVRSSGAAIASNGLRPAQTPRDQLSASAEWHRPGSLRLGTTLRYVGRQYEDDQNSRRLTDALTVDAVAIMPVGKGFSVELRGENLANVEVQAGIASGGTIERATPRSLTIGLRYALR